MLVFLGKLFFSTAFLITIILVTREVTGLSISYAMVIGALISALIFLMFDATEAKPSADSTFHKLKIRAMKKKPGK